MTPCRLVAALALPILAGACATIPQRELSSALAFEGIKSPWKAQWVGTPDVGWVVLVHEALKQVGPEICAAYQVRFSVSKSTAGYEIEREADLEPVQEVTFNDCASARPNEFREIDSSTGGLNDDELRTVVQRIRALPRIATADGQRLKFHYEKEEFRIALLRIDLKKVLSLKVNSSDSFWFTLGSGPMLGDALDIGLIYENGDLTEAKVSPTRPISGNP